MRLERQLRVTPEAAAQARDALDGLRPEPRLGDVRLLVSELVTNAVRHAALAPGDAIGLVVDAAPARLRVEVHDPGRGFVPAVRPHDPTRPSGWGLFLVERLADRWGVEAAAATVVWFELDRAAA